MSLKKTLKEKQIEAYLNESPEVGETISVFHVDKMCDVTVKEVFEDGSVLVHFSYYGDVIFAKDDYKRDTYMIGKNPMVEKPWNSSLRIIGFSLESILSSCGYDRKNRQIRSEMFGTVEIKELNWNPHLIDINGEKVYYQRDFVWTLKDKQSLINSIYNHIDIGKIVIRNRGYEWVKSEVDKGNTPGYRDIVDGKQRLNAILGFVMDEFPDSEGNYYSEFSELAKRKFGGFYGMAYGELGENTSDEDVKKVFLGVNFTGVPMSQEHVEFVKSIQL